MANEEHLAVLKQGVEVWNKWRRENPDIQPDLSEADLRGEPDLSKADLRGANLSKANLFRADLSGGYLSEAHLSEAHLVWAYLVGAHLSRADLHLAHLSGADLSRADLSGADLSRADLSGAHLSGADLSRADLHLAHLVGADLRGADLVGADLRGAFLSKAHFVRADLSRADFEKARIEWTIFGNVDLSQAKHLDKVRHDGPSTVGIDTIYQSGGNIPEVFLRGAGVPDIFITYMRSLIGQPIQFYSCFISYSSKDQEFAERLHADLQAKQVRVWFAPEDLKTGDRFRERIDESIRVYDKLMVILSENSVGSVWVEKEVVTAMGREEDKRETVLFPIRLDDTVMKSDKYWASEIRHSRHIGDFCQWKDHDSYKKAFDRLMRDLSRVDEKKAAP
ncbi:MAG: toll/interleukin-1 receptor domain-containing protein [Chloroflexi bacterium]|nr:toll/interleukin-1 receptor domain-containing protein [Chloroflexota bacterium]